MKDMREVEGLTFKPQISERSREIARTSISGEDQKSFSKDGKKYKSPVVQKYLESRDAECTF